MRFVREQSKQSVVQVVDPQVYLRSVKKHLSEKQGLPAEHQRLTFTVAAAVDTAAYTPPLLGSAESLLSGLDSWQALVYHNKKCIGRFVKPRLYSVSQLGDTNCEGSSDHCPVQQLSIIYDCFKAACSDRPAQVSVPIVTTSSCEQYRFTVAGRCEGRNFILPVSYRFSGQQAAYGLQKSLYTTKHQQTKAAAAGSVSALSPLITTSDLAVTFGPTLSESKSSVSVTSYTAQHTEASRPETLLAASSSKMPANAKTVSKKQKQKQNARAAALASKQSDSPKSLASKQLHAEKPVLETPNSTDTPMAVPAASEDQSAAVNGFSANPVLDAVPKGITSNGWAQTESSSSIAGTSEGAVRSWQPKASRQLPPAAESATEDALDVQSCISETVSQPKISLRNGHADQAMPDGWHDDASVDGNSASHASAGPASQTAHATAHPEGLLPGAYAGSQAAGLYALPEAVQAWATDGAASTSPGDDADSPHPSMPRQSQNRSHLPSSSHTNGYMPDFSQAYPQATTGGLHPHSSLIGYSGSPSGSSQWQDTGPQPPPGLPQGIRPHGFGWGGSDAFTAAAARQASGMRDQMLPSSGQPSYAQSAHHRQPHAVPQSHGYAGHQHKQAAAGPNARLTSSLQSLDLASDSWQSRRPGQHPSGQRWGRGGRPTGHDGGGPATQPPSARVSPERLREGHSESDAHPPVRFPAASTGHRPHKALAAFQHPVYPSTASLPGGYAEQGLRPSSVSVRQYDSRHGNGTTQAQQAAVTAAMLAASGQSAGAQADSRPMMVDWQRPAPLQSRDLAAATDVERLLQQLTPVLPEKGQSAGQLTLGDLWQWYLEPSLYGTEVLTLGGSRGPSVSYYVPYLSAMQLLLPLPAETASQPQSAAGSHPTQTQQPSLSAASAQHSEDAQGAPAAAVHLKEAVQEQDATEPAGGHQQPATASRAPKPGRVYQVEADWPSWPRQVQPLVELFDTELPFNRVPMHDKVQELAAGRLASGLPGSLLNSQPLAELHPASWFSVAWYPAYRIPDAPLNGRFLTFHHVSPQHSSSQHRLVTDGFKDVGQSSQQVDSKGQAATMSMASLDVPVSGLKLCNLHGERWLEPLSMEAVVDNKANQHGSQLRNSNHSRSSSVPQALQHHLNGLQHGAEYMARGQGLRLLGPEGPERLQQRHPDFEFFHTRH